MGFFDFVFIGIGLSMDAFAVAICKGLKMQKLKYGQAFTIAAFFGGFQGLMPFLGWAICRNFESYIKSADHWIAFVLLGFIGGKMIYESFKNDEDDSKDTFDIKELFVMAVATSIDALAVGITFAFSGVLNVGWAVTIIATITFGLSLFGVFLGHKFGARYKKKAELTGGVILILIGAKILLEDLGIINLEIF